MQIKKNWLAGALLAAALGVLILASSSSAISMATCNPATSAALDLAVHNASCTTIVLKATPSDHNKKSYFTDDAGTPANGFEVDHPVLITGATDSSGNCKAQKTTIVDGDPAPGGSPGSNGPVFMVESNNVQFKCFTVRFGTAGVSSDGFDGLNVNNMVFQGNGRDQTGGAPNGDGIWVQDGNNVQVKNSTFTGQGNDAVESDVNVSTTNRGWSLKKDTMTGVHNSCADLSENTATTIGELVSGKPANGITCSVAGTSDTDPAIYLNDQGVGLVAGDANKVYASTVTNSHRSCFDVEGDFAQFLANNCITSQGTSGEGVYLSGDSIKADSFSTTISSGHTGSTCVDANGDLLKLTNVKCGASRDMGIVVNGDDATVTNVQVRQSQNLCLLANGNHQIWNTASCKQVTQTSGTDYGLQSTGNTGGSPSSFTSIAIGDTYDACFEADNPGESFKKISCHGSSGSYGIYVDNDAVTVDGFDFGSTSSGCAVADSTNGTNTTFKNGHCARVLSDEAVYGYNDKFVVDKVVVDAAYGDCFAYYDAGGNAIDGSLTNSTGTNCSIGDTSDQGIDWAGTGTNTISNNQISGSSAESLYVSVTPTGSTDYTVKNNKFHDALTSDCVFIGLVDTLDFEGNKAQACQDSAFSLDVNDEPIVNNNIGNDASGFSSGASMEVFCENTCDTGTVNGNQLDGGGNEADGLHIENRSGGTGLTVNTNTVTNMTGIGIHLPTADNGDNSLFGNTVLNAGDVDDTTFGILVESDGNTLSTSKVSGSFDNGIEIALGADNNSLDHNNSHDNGEDGIHILGDSTTSTTDTVKNNAGEGFEDDGTNTTINGGASSGNREDCTGSDATGTYNAATLAGCADGSDFTDDGVIDRPIKKFVGRIF